MLSRLLTVREQLVLGGLALALALGAVVLAWHSHSIQASGTVELAPAHRLDVPPPAVAQMPSPPPSVRPAATPAPASTEPPPEIGVAVMGEVKHPGLYWLPPDARVHHLIAAAGGATWNADTSNFNLAARLIDTSVLTVPPKPQLEYDRQTLRRPPPPYPVYNPHEYLLDGQALPTQDAPPPTPAPSSFGSLPSEAININTASAATLETLPGVGPVIAARIVEYRTQTPFQNVDELMNVSGIGEKKLAAVRPFVTTQ